MAKLALPVGAMADVLTTFPGAPERDRALSALDGLGLRYEAVAAEPGYRLVGAGALAMPTEARRELAAARGADMACSGWVDHRPARIAVPTEQPPAYTGDIFGRAAVMVLASCTADETRIRIIAHISGDLTGVFPYLNAEMKHACYNAQGPTFTFMDGHRMVTAYARRVAVAKADEIVDAWRVLEALRRRANEVWAGRADIEPCYERREKPPALEIYKRLPQTNCGRCGQRTCLAFAVKVHGGHVPASLCAPVFAGERADLKEALVEVVSALGVGL